MRTRLILRLLQAVPTLLILVTLTFFMLRAAPGGPFDSEEGITEQTRAQLEAAYHFDEPIAAQYLRYLGSLMRGDLGPSYQYPDRSVNELIAAGLPVSATLGTLAIIGGLLFGLALGITAARAPGSLVDRLVMGFSLLGLSVPSFVIAPLLVLLFAVTLRWLPAGGWNGRISDWILPVVALALPHLATVARLSRNAMIEVLQAPYIRTARAKGLSERRIVLRHAIKPVLLPVISYLGPAAAATLTGSVVVEQIFGLPGIGRYFVLGAFNRDYGLVMGVVLLYGSLIVLFNLIVDLLYARLDPRLHA
ncbi:ABC transporter permease subunit [Hydrocarboniphaga effusa]|jgi:oligopeptide transport system permease protein|uniref:ABC transporter permease subunit n=1 Tax=Hydrocarboniphaga effusa TaxID=243629 RepID=UPI00398BCA5B